MLRIIDQEQGERMAWDLYVAGNGKKNETWPDYARRTGTLAVTPPDAASVREQDQRTIQTVRNKLGRLYQIGRAHV